MKLVEFSDGTFGVRLTWSFGWSFVDLKNGQFKWRRGSRYFKDCRGTREEAKNALQSRALSYKIINPTG